MSTTSSAASSLPRLPLPVGCSLALPYAEPEVNLRHLTTARWLISEESAAPRAEASRSSGGVPLSMREALQVSKGKAWKAQEEASEWWRCHRSTRFGQKRPGRPSFFSLMASPEEHTTPATQRRRLREDTAAPQPLQEEEPVLRGAKSGGLSLSSSGAAVRCELRLSEYLALQLCHKALDAHPSQLDEERERTLQHLQRMQQHLGELRWMTGNLRYSRAMEQVAFHSESAELRRRLAAAQQRLHLLQQAVKTEEERVETSVK